MRGYLEGLLGDASPDELTTYLTAGIRNDEVRGGFGLVTCLLALRRLPHRPAAQPAVHPRLLGVGARPGRDHVAGHARPQARDRADRADLHPAPALRRHAADARRPPRARRGRRRAAAGPGRDRGRRRRAHHPGRRRAAGPAVLRVRPGAHGARRTDRAGARDHAPRHDLHAGRRRQDGRLPQRRRLAGRLHGPAHRRPGARRWPGARRRARPSRSSSRGREGHGHRHPRSRSTPASTR